MDLVDKQARQTTNFLLRDSWFPGSSTFTLAWCMSSVRVQKQRLDTKQCAFRVVAGQARVCSVPLVMILTKHSWPRHISM